MIPLQYQNSPIISQLVDYVYQQFDASQVYDDFYDLAVNVQTAQGFGLDIWGRIVGANRLISLPSSVDYFGFAGTPQKPFNQAIFYTGQNGALSAFKLSDGAFRTLIMLKAYKNITRMTSPNINKILTTLFGSRGRCYCLETGPMAMRFTFEFTLADWELAILTNISYCPKPAGVSLEILATDITTTFSFAETGQGLPFGTAPFISAGALTNG